MRSGGDVEPNALTPHNAETIAYKLTHAHTNTHTKQPLLLLDVDDRM